MMLPPLLAIAQGRRARPRRVTIKPKEIGLHIGIADVLRRFARADCRWAHYPAGEHRDIRTAAKLKAMGVQRGWPDFILFDPAGRLHCLEMKREGENLNDDQEAFAAWCAERSVPHAVARSIDEALRVFAAWGVLRVKIGGAP